MTSPEPRESPRTPAVLSEFDAEDIAWALLRDGGDSGDLDILVEASRFDDVRGLFRRHEFDEFPTLGRGSHVFFVGTDRDSGWIKFDFVTELAFGRHFELKTEAAADCLARRRRRGSDYHLDPDDAFWALLFHCILDKRRIVPDRRRRLQQLTLGATADGPLAVVFTSVAPTQWPPERAIAAAAAGDTEALLGLGRSLTQRWRRRDPAGTLGRVATRRTLSFLHRRTPLGRARPRPVDNAPGPQGS
jgi:hypothetical protein